MPTRIIRPSRTRSTWALYAKSLLNAALFFIVFMILAPWASHSLAPSPLPVPLWLRSAGVVLAIAGAGIWVACLDVFSRHGRGTPFPLDAPSRLVTSGPFAVIRNPIMAAELAVVWGEALYFNGAGLFGYAAIATLAAHVIVVYVEEPELQERFGERFAAYCRGVPRWLPRRIRP
jgi:protein-S-isoprenylcysteine O-methyltransferase Ste14